MSITDNILKAAELRKQGINVTTGEIGWRRRFAEQRNDPSLMDFTKPLSPQDQAAMESGLAKERAQQDLTQNLALAGFGAFTGAGLGGLLEGGGAAAAGGTGAAEAASLVGPATGTIEAAPVIGAAGAPVASALPAAGAAGAASMLGPATGTVEAAPVIGGSGAPTVSGVAAGGGPFMPVGASGGATGGAALEQASPLLEIAGRGLPAALGAIGANEQADAYKDVANQYMAMGAPYRSRLSDLYSDPEGYLNSAEVLIPVQNATNVLARSLSTKGNPIGSGNALQQLQNYASEQLFSRLGQEKDRLAGFGGLTQYAAAAPQASMAGIGAQKGVYDAIGAGAADIFNPPKRLTLEDLLRNY